MTIYYKDMHIKSKLPNNFDAGRARGHVECAVYYRTLDELKSRVDTENQFVRDTIKEIICNIDDLSRGIDSTTEFVFNEYKRIVESGD